MASALFWKGKTVWITGASSGIGRALAEALSPLGARLILSATHKEPTEFVRNTLTMPNRAMVLAFDLSGPCDFSALAERALAFTGQVDVLFNNAGLSQRATAADTTEAVDRLLMEINYFSNIGITKALLPHFRNHGHGHIVVTSSLAGKTGFFLRSGYAASKHALHGFYDSLRLEEEGNGLLITVVCPNRVRTDISLKALNATGEPTGTQDPRLSTGLSPNNVAACMIGAVERGKRELLIGADVQVAVWLKALLPSWFHRILRRQRSR